MKNYLAINQSLIDFGLSVFFDLRIILCLKALHFQKFKQMVNKEEQFYLRQHTFAIKKYEKSAEECKIQREARARMERRKTLIALNPPLTQPDFNRRMTKLSKISFFC